MSLLSLVREAATAWPSISAIGNMVAVPTHCLFGSGSVVRVFVEGGNDAFVVHDGGGAIDEFSSGGGEFPNTVKLLRSFLRDGGFKVNDSGEIHAPVVPLNELAPTIALVANAAKEAAEFLGGKWKPTIKRDFRGDLRKLLEAEFPQLKLEQEFRFIGESAKQHKFAFAVPIHSGAQLLIDAVAHEQSAISASVLRNLDVRNLQTPGLIQRVVYDDRDEWRAEDLNLLKLGATPIAFSRAGEVLPRLAA